MSEIINKYKTPEKYNDIKIGDKVKVVKILDEKRKEFLKENEIYTITEKNNCDIRFCNSIHCPHIGIALSGNGIPLCNTILTSKKGVKYIL